MTLFMTWAQGRVEMSSVAPTAHKAISTKGGHKLLDSNQVLELGSTAKGCLAGRQAGRQGDCSAENSPKGLGCGFPE